MDERKHQLDEEKKKKRKGAAEEESGIAGTKSGGTLNAAKSRGSKAK